MAGAGNRGGTARRKPKLKPAAIADPFASTILSYQLADAEGLNEGLLDMIAAWRDEDPQGLAASNVAGWHSPRTLFLRREQAVIELTEHVRLALVAYVRRYIADFHPNKWPTFTEGWVNINGPGGFNVPHTHDEFQVSGCYYVAVPKPSSETSGAIDFLNPASAVPPLLELGRKMSPARYRILPKPGQMLIFPAHLSHWVLPNEEAQDRVSIAFNLRVMDRS